MESAEEYEFIEVTLKDQGSSGWPFLYALNQTLLAEQRHHDLRDKLVLASGCGKRIYDMSDHGSSDYEPIPLHPMSSRSSSAVMGESCGPCLMTSLYLILASASALVGRMRRVYDRFGVLVSIRRMIEGR
jgi:hypothetical protein